ncbi:histidine kinase [Actinomadura sp. B10D3]|uniref:sensor histidine kinase n=1 Tax=Actinomadura sp. B10D3 TaxID=3153557 RepID=UPI00325F282A
MNDSAAPVPGTATPARRPALRRAAHALTHTVTHTVSGTVRDAARDALRGAVTRRPSRTALIKDVLLFGVLALPVTANLISPLQPALPSWWAQVAGLGVLAAAVAVCRAWPAAALLTAIALILVHGNFVFAMPVMSYLAGLRTARARPLLWGFTAVFVGGSLLSVARGLDVTTWFPSTVWLVLLGVLPWLVGRYWRQYQKLLRAGWERAEHLENQQRIIAERERLRERARIAQDMHDSLGHELALIAVRAGALEVAADLGDRHRAAAAELRAGAADATEHLREIIGVLRDDAPGDAPADSAGALPAGGGVPVPPARESIPELVARARASGVPVSLTTGPVGASGDAPPEPASLTALTAHRVVQEAITNAAKHAPGAAVTVTLARRDGDPATITVTVANDPPPGGPPSGGAALASGGRGLAGLTERVRLLGGTLHAAPTPEGGFQVTAELPDTPHLPAHPPPDRTDTGDTGDTVNAPGPTGRDALRSALGFTSFASSGRTAPGERTSEDGWATESARHLARKRRQARRGLITAIAVPTALMALLGAIMLGYHVYATLNSVLPPDDYAALRVGTPQDRVEEALPPREATGTAVVRDVVPEPADADCRYYRPDADLLGTARIYRLCFTGGRLTAKNSYDTHQLSVQNRDDREDP